MWFLRAEVVAASMTLLLCGLECKPQSVNTDCLSDENFLDSLDGTGSAKPCSSNKSSVNGECSCVPINQCLGCTPVADGVAPPSATGPQTDDEGGFILLGLVDDRTIDITVGDRQNAHCGDILSVCCETKCRTTPPTPKMETKVDIHNCGIRTTNGVGVTVNGFEDSQAQLGEFPWMVAVLDQVTNYVGGGSLVHPRVILTAAHKVHKKEARDLVARIGDWDLSTTNEPNPSENINVERIVFHPDFNRATMVNNVALLILKSEAALGPTVMPICLPEPGQNFDGADCYVTGWGKDVFGFTGRFQKILKEVHVPAVSHSQCQSLLRNTVLGSGFNLHNTFNCAGANGEDACEGDGGSPLVCPDPSNPDRYVQMGVVAWGIGCGKVGNPGVYGSIPATVEWINRVIQDEVGQVGFDIRSKPVSK